MIRNILLFFRKKRKISSVFGFFEVDKEVYFDWNRFNFSIKKIVGLTLSKEKREIIKKLHQKIRAVDDHPLLYSLYKIKREISHLKEENKQDFLFLTEINKVESRFTFHFEKKIYELRLRAILEHLEFVPYTNILSKKEIYEEVIHIESLFHGVYEIERLVKKLKFLLDSARFEKQALFI